MQTTFHFSKLEECASLPVFGPIASEFVTWLIQRGYKRHSIRKMLRMIVYFESIATTHGIYRLEQIDDDIFAKCERSWREQFCARTRNVAPGALAEFLIERGFLIPRKQPLSVRSTYLSLYVQYLQTVRGVSPITIEKHRNRASQLLDFLRVDNDPNWLNQLTLADLEAFMKKAARRVNRRTLARIVSSIRAFLYFLVGRGEISEHLLQLESPRIYQYEDLPRSIPWETVRAFLNSIDRSGLVGLRDYAMFLMIATYGLRSYDVTTLTLDSLRWRERKICIRQQKTGVVLELPLTDAVGAALVKYLKAISPHPPCRNVFLRLTAPIQPLKRSAIGRACQVWSSKSGLNLTWKGPHCIRHSYALFLLRNRTSLKTIGDLLGHRAFNSTWTYLRLSIEDLREVALPLPVERNSGKGVRP